MTLTLMIANQSFDTPLKLIKWVYMYHHTKFGCKMLCGSENIVQKTFDEILNLHCDLDLEHRH